MSEGEWNSNVTNNNNERRKKLLKIWRVIYIWFLCTTVTAICLNKTKLRISNGQKWNGVRFWNFILGGGAERHANTHRFTPHLFYLCEFILNPMLPTLASMTDLICLKWLRFTTECVYVRNELCVYLPSQPLGSLKCAQRQSCSLFHLYIFYLFFAVCLPTIIIHFLAWVRLLVRPYILNT